MKSKCSGFTLLETLLVLMVMSVIIVMSAHYQTHEIRQEKSRQIGQQLYQYHNAIKAYTMNGVASFALLPTGTYSGVRWLKSTTCGGNAAREYLPCSFPEVIEFGQLAFTSVVTKGLNADSDPVVRVATSTTPFKTGDGVERSDLAGLAAIAAAGYSSVFAPISSTFGSVSSDPKTAVITMTAYNAPGGDDIWLRTNGTNEMKGSITFSGTNPEDNNLQGVNRITAENGGTLILGNSGSLTGDLVVEYDSEILGELYVQDDLNVDGLAAIKGDVRSGANIIANNNVVAGNDLLASRDVVADRDLIAGGQLIVDSDARIKGDTSILGKTTISGDAIVKERLIALQNLTVSRNSLFLGNATINGQAELKGGFRAGSDSYIDGYLHLGMTVTEGAHCNDLGTLAKLANGAAVSCASNKWEKLNGKLEVATHCEAQTLKYEKYNKKITDSNYNKSSSHSTTGSKNVPRVAVGSIDGMIYASDTYGNTCGQYRYTVQTIFTCLTTGEYSEPEISYSRRKVECETPGWAAGGGIENGA
ncbi:prepilin-type N-terminal cleavage/methylation domain-containing protein [Neptuniibacter sp. QD37_11]|uniref:prepilin-type N-terminal cleavage/methylation domain-containing protein n=1 Tax=Neptuniibacter sp. QD37_11 TaxID=3398209 RepID=UPI0039F62EAD